MFKALSNEEIKRLELDMVTLENWCHGFHLIKIVETNVVGLDGKVVETRRSVEQSPIIDWRASARRLELLFPEKYGLSRAHSEAKARRELDVIVENSETLKNG